MERKSNRQTLLELFIGNMIFGIVGEVVILTLMNQKVQTTIGFLIGVILSCVNAWSMNASLEAALDLQEADAQKKAMFGYISRNTVLIVVLVLMYVFKIGNILAALVGVFALKISAYLQPLIHKLFFKKKFEKR